jgi:FkbM family methyltransferase
METPSADVASSSSSDLTRVVRRETSLWVRNQRAAQDLAIINEVFERDCYELRLLSLLMPNVRTILDIGGHIGTFGLLAMRCWPGARLIALEPNPLSCELYKKNLASNGIDGATVLCEAVSYDPSCIVLMEADSSTGGCILKSAGDAAALSAAGPRAGQETYRILEQTVKCTTVEELSIRLGLSQGIDLGKWDCEGSEIAAFERLSPQAAVLFGAIVGEYHFDEGFAAFAELTRRAFPHLTVFGGNGQAIGPFWGLRRSTARVLDPYRRAKSGLRTLKRRTFGRARS